MARARLTSTIHPPSESSLKKHPTKPPRQASRDLARQRRIQGFRVTGFTAIVHVTEHFAYDAGQIIYLTKLLRGVDLKFTRLPAERVKAPINRKLPRF